MTLTRFKEVGVSETYTADCVWDFSGVVWTLHGCYIYEKDHAQYALFDSGVHITDII